MTGSPNGQASTAIPSADWWRPPRSPASRPAGGTVAFVSLVAFSLVLLLAPQLYFPQLQPLRLAVVTAVTALLASVIGRALRGQSLAPHRRETTVIALLLGWAVATVPFSLWPGGSVNALTDSFIKVTATFWLVGVTVSTLRRLQTVCWILSLTSVLLGSVGVNNYLSGRFMVGGVAMFARLQGYDAPLTQNPNDLALLLNMIMPVTTGFFLSTRRPVLRGVLGGVLLLSVMTVILTFSRQGFLGLVVTFLIYMWRFVRSPRRRTWAGVGLLVVLLCLPLIPGSYYARIATITDVEDDPTGSAQDRYAGNIAALRYVAAHPIIGAGIGQEVLALNGERGRPIWKAVHNAYLEYAVDLGLPGLGLFLGLLGLCLKAVHNVQVRVRSDSTQSALFHLAEAIEISLLTFAACVVFAPVAYQFYFYYFGGLALATRLISEATASNETTRPSHTPPRRQPARSMLAVGSGARSAEQV